jgi:hypothetical protein
MFLSTCVCSVPVGAECGAVNSSTLRGTEFVNATVMQYLKRQGVDFHRTHNPDIKGAVIEI